MAPSVGPSNVDFFTATAWKGDKHTYKIGDDIQLYPGSLNDKFKSCVVAQDAKVLAWQHATSSGIYKELEGAVESLADMQGLSRFKVIQGTTGVIAFRFEDKTSDEKKKWSLQLNAADVGNTLIYSNSQEPGDDLDGFRLVGIMPKDGPPVTTALYVRNVKTGEYIANGSVFFQWNREDQQVEIVSQENFPKQLKARRTTASRFVLELISDNPDAN